MIKKGRLVEDTKTVVKASNQSESFIINHEHFEGPFDLKEEDLYDRYLQGPNPWPRGMPEFCRAVLTYYHEIENGHRSIGLRMLHHPPQSSPVPDGVFGSSPHCDHGFITILSQDDVGRLQIKTPNGEWISAPNMITSNSETAFQLNLGDSASKWANDCFTSNSSSYPQLDLGTRWCPADKQPNYEPQTYGQHLKTSLSNNYAELYKTIDGASNEDTKNAETNSR
ncbi:unnamed protein product [Rotaria socialis]|uniref:Isopenicillin N synthase-like Fe(2+) 2OG dioxygenase domain-containing protein n=1 Tax=Rotaria socialis TaxID=392032 RepID=A0A817ZJJ9_9BILA|nr:unnamed protein product [Rotaria socialis]CAF3556493.1 unnamed protein product [Rotaria socialis]CAF4223511.1 unnamed protein product [Rotaria socialis]CAF4288959.1 unnamed protein product [Rotaria socialis]